jgi:8-oxo-dGTP pyrophosphatase MutT (NUDIX family)
MTTGACQRATSRAARRREAALREVEEETGLRELAMVTQLPTIDWYFRDRGKLVHKFCHFFLIECVGGEAAPQLDEGITECIWRAPDVAIEMVPYANARGVMRAASNTLDTEGDAAAGLKAEPGGVVS